MTQGARSKTVMT